MGRIPSAALSAQNITPGQAGEPSGQQSRVDFERGGHGLPLLGEGNVPVFCSRETWKAWWEENAGGKVVKSEQSGDFVTEVIFTGFPSERDGSRKFWTVDAHNTKTGVRYSLGSFTTLEEAVAFLESTKGPSSEKVTVG